MGHLLSSTGSILQGQTRMSGLKSTAFPQVALIAGVLASGLLVSTVDARPAQAFPNQASECTGCHGNGSVAGKVTAKPSTTSPASGTTYTVAITPPATPNGGRTGFWIANSTAAGATGTTTGVTGGPSSARSYTASMEAPAAPGTYYYKVWANRGSANRSAQTNFASYSITVTGPTPGPTPAPAPTAATTTSIWIVSATRGTSRTTTLKRGKTALVEALVGQGSTGLNGVRVTLQAHRPGRAWSTVTTRRTTTMSGYNGTALAPIKPLHTTYYRWVSSATATSLGSASQTAKVHVRP
jgi:hypothetical protein